MDHQPVLELPTGPPRPSRPPRPGASLVRVTVHDTGAGDHFAEPCRPV